MVLIGQPREAAPAAIPAGSEDPQPLAFTRVETGCHRSRKRPLQASDRAARTEDARRGDDNRNYA